MEGNFAAQPQSGHGESSRKPDISLLPSLPEIIDSGPPTANRYSDADIFWNSMMTETDGSSRSDTSMKGTTNFSLAERQRHNFQQQGIPRENHEKPMSRAKPLESRMDSRSMQQLEGNITHGKERADNDLVVMLFSIPNYNRSPFSRMSDSKTSKGSVSPCTQECDGFNDSKMSVNQSSGITSHVLPNGTGPQTLTWSVCINELLSNDGVDSAVKDAVEERLKNSDMANHHQSNGTKGVSPTAIGLVPNFSYPIGASMFYDRLDDEQIPPSPNDYGVDEDEYLEQQLEALLADETSVIERQSPELQQSTILKPLSGLSFQSSSYLSLATDDSLYCDPPPLVNRVQDSVDALLSEILTSAELRLLHNILQVNSIEKRCNGTTTSHETLICGLHYIITGLQDRISHLEDTLLPELCEELEKKSSTVDLWATELQSFHKQITQLKSTVDFGSKVLERCWVREYEVWNLLMQIRQKRKSKWRRLLGAVTGRPRKRYEEVKGDILSPPRDSQTPVAGSSRQHISARELEALIHIAQQNARILQEDADDMVERVETCKRAANASPAIDDAGRPSSCRE